MAGSISDPLAETESDNCYKHASVIMSCSIYLSISTYYPLCLAGHAESGTSLRAPAPVRDDGALSCLKCGNSMDLGWRTYHSRQDLIARMVLIPWIEVRGKEDVVWYKISPNNLSSS